MRHLLPLILLFLPLASFAQGLKSENNTLTHSAELRVQANFTKHFKVRDQGINLLLREEIFARMYESTYSQLDDATLVAQPYFRRSYTSVGLEYHPVPYFRVGALYTLKLYGNKIKASDGTTVNPANMFLRHRLAVYVTGQYTYQNWKFSLRERLDMNFRTDSVNLNEKNSTDLTLRHKLQAQYSIPGKPLKVYSYVELWNTLNQPVSYLNTYAGKDAGGNPTAYAGKDADGNYTSAVAKPFGQYLSEVRAQVGLSWRVDKLNTLTLAYRYTYGYSRDINITRSKANIELTHARSHGHFIILAYNLNW